MGLELALHGACLPGLEGKGCAAWLLGARNGRSRPFWPIAEQRPGVFSHAVLLRAQRYLRGNTAQSITHIIPAKCGISPGARPAHACPQSPLQNCLPACLHCPSPEGLESWLLPLKHGRVLLAMGLVHIYMSLRAALAALDLGRGKFCQKSYIHLWIGLQRPRA